MWLVKNSGCHCPKPTGKCISNTHLIFKNLEILIDRFLIEADGEAETRRNRNDDDGYHLT